MSWLSGEVGVVNGFIELTSPEFIFYLGFLTLKPLGFSAELQDFFIILLTLLSMCILGDCSPDFNVFLNLVRKSGDYCSEFLAFEKVSNLRFTL